MTTIAAVETEQGVTFAYDSRVSDNHRVFETDQHKVVLNNGIVFGVAGAIRALNLITHSPDIPGPPTKGNPDRWVTNVLTPALTQLLEPIRKADSWETQILAVVRGRVYDFGGDMDWSRTADGLYAAGSGACYALGALSAGATAERAVEIAKMHDSGTGGEVRTYAS